MTILLDSTERSADAPRLSRQPVEKRLVFLDSMRGLASLSVVASHYIMAYGLCQGWLWTNTPLHIWWDGFAAVSLFFVLSGFVLSLRYFQSADPGGKVDLCIGGYISSRVCRIWLPYIVIVLLSAALYRAMWLPVGTAPSPTAWIQSFWNAPLTGSMVVHEANLLRRGEFALLPQAWTLAVEMQLSLLVPFGIVIAARSSWWLAVATLMLTYLGVPAFAVHFSIGMLLAKHHDDLLRALSGRRILGGLLLVCGILLYTFRYTLPAYVGLDGGARWLWLVTGLGSAMIMVFVMGSRLAKLALSHRWVCAVGRVSYSVYLVHFAVLLCLTPRFVLWSNRMGLPIPGALGLLFTVLVTLLLSFVLYPVIELPSVRLGKWIGRKWQDIIGPRPIGA